MKMHLTKSKLCVGIDPHAYLLKKWGLDDNVKGLEVYSKTILEAVENLVSSGDYQISIKPQLALFERHGSAGLKVLEDFLTAEKTDVSVIMDAKRGDIGSTMRGYADAFLRKGAPFEGDALTISPYLGVESVRETIDLAVQNKKTVFLLCLTSNKEAYGLQHAKISENSLTVAKEVFDFAKNYNADYLAIDQNTSGHDIKQQYDYIPVGLVVGATIKDGAKEAGINLSEFNGCFLTPGFGAQGANFADLEELFGGRFGGDGNLVIINSSRSISEAGPDIKNVELNIRDIYGKMINQ